MLTPYLDPLRVPDPLSPIAVEADGTHRYRLELLAGSQMVHSQLPSPTPFWGYQGMFPGPLIEVPLSSKVTIEFVNSLPIAANPRSQWPFFIRADLPGRPPAFVPPKPWTIVHLHGSPTQAEYDGWADNAYFPGESSIHHFPQQLAPALLCTTIMHT